MGMKLVLAAVALPAALALTPGASAKGPIRIASVTVPYRHVSVRWTGPYLKLGYVQIATRPDTGTDGWFLPENRIRYDYWLDPGRTNWIDKEAIKPGTYYLRVDGWDDECTLFDYGNGTTGWLGCDSFSDIVRFTVKPICKRRLARRGYYVCRNGRRIWHKPLYRNVCR
jgi:hypothetical protein